MQINLNPTSERGASRDAVNRPRETLGDSHLISSDPRSRFLMLRCFGSSPSRGPLFLGEAVTDNAFQGAYSSRRFQTIGDELELILLGGQSDRLA